MVTQGETEFSLAFFCVPVPSVMPLRALQLAGYLRIEEIFLNVIMCLRSCLSVCGGFVFLRFEYGE
jgi:hypothetical protein